MTIPYRQRGISRSNVVLATLLAISLLAHIGVASIRRPVGPRYGQGIHGNPPNKTIEPDRLRIATWNIHRGKSIKDVENLANTARYLQGFDIAGLNEVGGAFWPRRDQAARLGSMLHTGWLFDPAQRRWYIDYFGNALLSRLVPGQWISLPIIHDLHKHGDRHLLQVDYTWQGKPFVVLILHAERGPIRDRQIRYVFKQFERFPRAILMGDFNALPSSSIMQEVHRLPGVKSALASVPHKPLRQQRDWIFVRGFDVVKAGFKPRGPSDHPLVWASLRWPSGNAAAAGS